MVKNLIAFGLLIFSWSNIRFVWFEAEGLSEISGDFSKTLDLDALELKLGILHQQADILADQRDALAQGDGIGAASFDKKKN